MQKVNGSLSFLSFFISPRDAPLDKWETKDMGRKSENDAGVLGFRASCVSACSSFRGEG